MSLVQFYMNGDGRYHIVCSECGAIVSSDATMAEVAEYSRANIKVLCFDCDSKEVDNPPNHLLSILSNYILGIGNVVFLAEWIPNPLNPLIQQLQLHRISLTTYFDLKTGRGIAYSPLSSWSKSPQQTIKNEVFNGIERKTL